MSHLLVQTEKNIRAHALLHPDQFVFVAVSGGLDSMALLHVICKLAGKHGWIPVVLHFNHQLRGQESDADEAFVRDAVAGLGLKCIVDRADVKKHARERRLSIEMAARELRHDFFARTSSTLGIDVLALGHHADDQVELFFLRAFRGSGGEGLAGMDWSSESPKRARLRLIRPFLNLAKRELREFVDREKIAFREDPTNAELDQDRNRIRNELLPLLRAKYQPALTRTTLRLMEIVGVENDFVTQTARAWLLRKNDLPFDQLHLAVQRQVLRIGLVDMGITPEFELIERLRASPNEVVMVNPQLTIWRDRKGNLKSRPVSSSGFRGESLLVDLAAGEGQASFGGLQILWKVRTWDPRMHGRPKAREGCEYFDAEKLGTTVCLRHWRPGDRFQPIGMPKPVKLQDVLTNQKVPRDERRDLVVATTANNELFWVEKLRIAEGFKLVGDTRAVLQWSWERR